MKLKKIILSSLLSVLCSASYGQIRYIPVNAHSFSASLGGGAAVLLGDFKTKFFTPVGRVNIDYNFTSYLSAGLEGQVGKLTTSKIDIPVINGMRVENNFVAANANFKLSWGKIFKPKPTSIVNGFYIGAGAGIINYSVTANRTDAQINTTPLLNDRQFSGTALVIPVNIGVDIDLSSFSKIRNSGININYQHSFSTDDHLDGFDVAIASNKFPDNYGFLSVAYKYYFGKLK